MEELQLRVSIAIDLINDMLSCDELFNHLVHNLIEEIENFDEDEAKDDLDLLITMKKLFDVDDEKIMLESVLEIYELFTSSRILRPYQQRWVTSDGCNRITWSNLDEKYHDDIFPLYFRYKKVDIKTIIESLEIPDLLCFDGYYTNSLEALLVLLRRLSSCVRYVDISMEVDLLPQFQSQIFNGLMMYLFDKIKDVIRKLNLSWMTDRQNLEMWAAAIEARGCPIPNTFGLGDGVVIQCCKPVREQRSWFSGHKKAHGFKAICITTPAGLMVGFGPFNGSTHDSACADIIGLDQLLEEDFTFPDGVPFVTFLDPGFRIGNAMITPIRRRQGMTEEEEEFNRVMCRIRISVEWGFAKLKNLFRMLNYKKNLKPLMSPIAAYFFVAMHLCNLHTILYGSQVAQYFDVEGISLEEYLADFKNLPTQ